MNQDQKNDVKDKFNIWIIHEIAKLKENPRVKTHEISTLFWKLNVYNIIRVYRDKEFMEQKLNELCDVWKKITSYRSDKDLYDKEINTKKPRVTKASKALLEIEKKDVSEMPFHFRVEDE
jgi:hypothetical protein